MKKTIFPILLLLLSIMIISLASAEVSHTFIVNKYYISTQPSQKIQTFFAEPLVGEQTVESCDPADFSFKLSNPSVARIFKFSISDFRGIAYYSQDVMMNPNEAKIIELKLQPDCSFRGTMNPKLTIETDDEQAILPLLIHVTGNTPLTKSDCLYYFNSTICGSSSYVKIGQGNRYEIDLKEMFFDPDNDVLYYSASSNNLQIKIDGEKATVKPYWHFTGAESVVFKAEDGKGGKAYSTTYYFHVIPNGRNLLENFLLWNWIWIAIIVILFLVILVLLIFK